jgi:bacteriocin biosynthesis cyclodehydratase domain-containing protein
MTNIVLEDALILQWNAGLVPLITSAGVMSLALELRQFLLSDALLQRVVLLLQQPISLASLIGQTCPPADPESVRDAVAELFSEKIIVCARSEAISRNASAFWDMVPCAGTRRPVAVESLLPNIGASLEALLRSSGVTIEAGADLAVLVTDDYALPGVGKLATGRTAVLLAKPVGNEIWIGPILSQETPLCWDCLVYWLRLRRWPELTVTDLAASETVPSSSVAWLPGTMTLASGLIATAATLWAAGQAPNQIASDLWTFNLHSLKSSAFPVLPRRNCPRCAPGMKRGTTPFLRGLQSPRTGILDRLRLSEEPVGGLQLANCAVLMPLPQPGIRDPVPPLSADGKAPGLEEALRRCTMEAVERYSCAFVGDEPIVRARLSEIDGISPNELLLFSETQMVAREEWNARPGTMHGVPECFDAQQPTAWTKAKGLLDNRERYVPAGCAWLWYPYPDEPFYNYADTNGCAAGNTAEEATLRALLELIERDALAVWWYNRLARPGVDLAHWAHRPVQAARDVFAAQRRSVELLDLTHDLCIPVYAAVSADEMGHHVFFGCAADLCAVHAAERALAELTQFWYWSTRSAPSPDQRLWLEKSSLQRHTYLVPAGQAPTPEPRQIDVQDALAVCAGKLKLAGLEAYIIDITRPELEIPVVRAVCPGLRHYGPRFAPGRLYNVPVKMAWLDRPLREQELNADVCVL